MTPRTVYITGASSGIGRGLALELASRGAHVVVSARRLPELEELVRVIAERGGKAQAIRVDVSNPDDAAEAVKQAEKLMGSLDMVIANAGVGTPGHISTMPWSEVSRTIDINIRGAFATLFAAIPIMLHQKHGHLVGVSSLAGRRGLPKSGAYSASKAALSGFLDTLRLDLALSNIKVTDVQPGFVETAILAGARNPTPFKWTVEKASRVIVSRLERAPSQIAFPWQLDLATSFARVLPAWLYDRILARTARG